MKDRSDSGLASRSAESANSDVVARLKGYDGRDFVALHIGDDYFLARGRSRDSGSTEVVLLAGPSSKANARDFAQRAANEMRMAQYLDGEWAAVPRSIVDEENFTGLVLDNADGTLLSRLIGRPFNVDELFPIAIAMVRAVERMHGIGIVHKDIKPANILYDASAGVARLTGFGIATRLPKERQAPAPPDFIAGTFAYMAPEQTGRMNRSIDTRSDLYSLGITLYQMATGELPFAANDAMEWIHCHVARTPTPASVKNGEIPLPFCDIVMKLLSKEAEDRYRTASGLRADLERCLREIEIQGESPRFVLGAEDTPQKLLFREKLYGREREFGQLVAAFDRVATKGMTEVVLVSGYSGIGKSSVINELHRFLVPPRGIFAAGKFDQYKRGIPYATLAQAFRSLVNQLLSQDEGSLSVWRTAIGGALGINGQVMVNLVPDLELIIGPQPPLAELTGGEAQNRFRQAFRQFVSVFARPEHPLVLFLDDLQWLDAATLDIFEDLALHGGDMPLLLVGAFRDNEVGPDHPLNRTIASLRTAGAAIQDVLLDGVRQEDIALMIADALDEGSPRVLPLSLLVYEKAGGNPFFTTQFVASLVDRGLLHHDPAVPGWQWDIQQIGSLNVSDNVVDLMMQRLRHLPAASGDVVKQLACLGNTVKLENYADILEISPDELDGLLREILDSGLLFQMGGSLFFAHDRVHEAAYLLLDDKERAAAHRFLGRRMLLCSDDNESEASLFEIADQLNRGGTKDLAEAELESLASLNLRAARKARGSAAYGAACRYLAIAMNQLGGDESPKNPYLAFAVALEEAECVFLSGDFARTELLIDKLLGRGGTKVELAAVHRLKVELRIVHSDNDAAVDAALVALRLFGIDLTAHPTQDGVDAEYAAIWDNLEGRPLTSFADLPPMTDAETLSVMRILAEMWPPAYFTDFHLCAIVTCKMVNLSLRHGRASSSTQGLAWFGWLLGPLFGRFREGLEVAQFAQEVAINGDNRLDLARTGVALGLTTTWTRPLGEALDIFEAADQVGRESGDIYYACYALSQSVQYRFIGGQALEKVGSFSRQALSFTRDVGFQDAVDQIAVFERATAALSGLTNGLATFSDNSFDEKDFEERLWRSPGSVAVCFYWTRKTMLRYLAEDFAGAIAAASNVYPTPWIEIVQVQHVDYHFYGALSLCAHSRAVGGLFDKADREQLDHHYRQLGDWAIGTASETFAAKHLLLSAEIADLDGQHMEAQQLYAASATRARDNGFIQDEAVACEAASRFYARLGLDQIARMYIAEARSAFQKWGAAAKVRQLERLYPSLPKTPMPTASALATATVAIEQFDLSTVIKVAQTVSGEIVLEKLIDGLMRTVLEHAGASRAMLALGTESAHAIESVATTSDGGVEVVCGEADTARFEYPAGILAEAMRTGETVIEDNAAAGPRFAQDEYIRSKRVRSLLVLPLVNQGKLIGALHLENTLAAGVFTRERLSILKLIASHAAIALENTRLYRDLERREAKIRRLVDADIIGVFMWNYEGDITEANDTLLAMLGFSREEFAKGGLRWVDLTPKEDWDADTLVVDEIKTTGRARPWEKVFLHKDGHRVPVLIGAAAFDASETEGGVAYILDLTERKRAEESVRAGDLRYRALQSEMAHANRVATVGQLSAAISHDVKQPLLSIVTSGAAGLRWLDREPPNLVAARSALERMVSEGHRAGEVLNRTRALVRKSSPQSQVFALGDLVSETISYVGVEVRANGIAIRMDTPETEVQISADRVQIQQVILNLVINGMEAITGAGVSGGSLMITVGRENLVTAYVDVCDNGPGAAPEMAGSVFDAFNSSKPDGMGMGLAISRTIIETHGGTLAYRPNHPSGAVFRFTIPVAGDVPTVAPPA
ncbi:AAA family ATPase [Neorhizobium sp. LMR1-1-1.1]